MKQRKNVFIALAAGVAVAGLAAFLFGTEKGRDTTRMMRRKGEYMLDEMEDLVENAREKFSDWRKNMARCKPEADKVAEMQDV